MKEFVEFDKWVHDLEWDIWDIKGQKDPLLDWLEAREDAAFRWAWNRAARQVTLLEKKAPLDEEETVWLERLEFTVEMVVKLTLNQHDEFSNGLWRCVHWVYEDFQLLARSARLHHHDPFLEKLRARYAVGLSHENL